MEAELEVEAAVTEHASHTADRTVVVRSVPLLAAYALATTGCFYSFPPVELKGAVLCALSLLATLDSLIGTRFAFQRKSLKIVERLRGWPYRIDYSDVARVAQEHINNRVYLKVQYRTREISVGGWRQFIFPRLQQQLDEIQKELEWRITRTEGQSAG